MKIVKGNLWNSKDAIILVTGNSFVKKNGELVMGRGAALEAKNRYPILPSIFGDQINRYFSETRKYGVLIAAPWVISPEGEKLYGSLVGVFQVKYNWFDKADLELIDYSVDVLNKMLWNSFPGASCPMNFPGIGNGKLSYEEVYPIIKRLPDSVTIYMK